jgi:ketosteroid isomerase-like protein
MTIETIQALEQQLLDAMFASDVPALEALLADELVFITHTGVLANKHTDLDAHRSGLLQLTELSSSEEQIRIYGTTAVVTLRLELEGTFDGEAFAGNFRYTRVWAQTAGRWQVVSAHVSQVFA